LICTMRLRTRSRSSTVNMRYPAPYSFVYLARRTQSDSDRGGQENVGRKASIPLIQALGEAYSVFDAGFLRPIFTMMNTAPPYSARWLHWTHGTGHISTRRISVTEDLMVWKYSSCRTLSLVTAGTC